MAHIKLRHVVGAMPHGARLRKRKGRLLKPVKPSYKVELWYKQQLLVLVGQLRQIAREELLPELKRNEPLYAKASDGLARDRAAYSPVVSAMIERMQRRTGGIEGVAQRLAEAATNRSLLETDERLKASIQRSVKIDISGFLSRSGPIQTVTEVAMKANTALITSIPKQYFEKLDASLVKNMERGMRYEDLAKEIERIGDVTESRAKLIARDQTGKLNGAMTQIRQISLGIEEYDWQTAGDERVRHTHAENDGKTFKWSDPPKETGHPGEDVNCRCVAIPRFDLDDEVDFSDLSIRESRGISMTAVLAIAGAFFSYANDSFNPDQPRDEHGRWTGGGEETHAELSGNEFGEHASTKDLRRAAMTHAEQHFIGKSFTNANSGHEIKITRQGMKHSLSGANVVELKLSAAMPQILSRAHYQGSFPPKAGREHLKAAHKYMARVKIGSEVLNVGVVTHERSSGHEHYDHFIVSKK